MTRLQSLSLPNMISMRLRRLYLRFSYLTGVLRFFRPGSEGCQDLVRGTKAALNGRIPLSCNASVNQLALAIVA